MLSRCLRMSFVFALVMTFALTSVAQIAYAEGSGGGSFDDDQIIYGPTIYNVRNAEYATLVYSGTSYNAALVALGYNPYDAKFTADVKAYLSDNSTGGSFYEFANLFTNQRPEPSLTLGNSSFVSAWIAAQSLYPENNLFGAIYTESLANSAKQRVEDILSGDVTGGGSGGGSGGDSTEYINFESALHYADYSSSEKYTPVLIGGNAKCYTYKPYRYSENGVTKYRFGTGQSHSDAAQLGPVLNVTLDRSIANDFVGNDYGIQFRAQYDSGKYLVIFQLIRTTEHTNKNNQIVNTLPYVDTFTYTGYTTEYTAYPETSNLGNYYYTIVDGEHMSIHKREGVSAISFNSNQGIWSSNFDRQLLVAGGSVQPPEPPTGDWPDNPTVVTPEPPELPEPRDPVIPNPPSDPVPTDPPTYITQPTYNVSVFTADLQGILDAMDEHCVHLQNALYTDLNALYNKLASVITSEGESIRSLVSSRFDWLGTVIVECIETLDSDIYDYFHWLSEQFDFQSSGGYDDNTVIAWLKKIYAKLGGGSPVNPKPVDPVSDPFDFGKWLSDLWNTFIADLIAIGAEGMAAIADDLQQLIHKFPFSIPWDIAAMLALLAAEPQTPVIQFPMFSYNGSVQVIQTTIDLSPYNNYVEPVRVMIKIGFAAILAWRTKDMMELLTMARGGNNA